VKNFKESGELLRAKLATRHRRLDKAEPVEKKSGWMEENRERLAAALESLGDGIVVTQTDGTICYVNPAFERLTGFADEEIVGKNGSVFVANGNSQKLQSLIRETLQRNEIWTGSVAIGKKDGSSFEAEVSVVPRPGSSDKRVEYVTVVRDVTARKQTEETLQAQMKLQEVMAAISTDFAVLSPQDIDKGIARALQKVGEFAGADSAYILLFSENGAKVGCVHEWRAQGMESQIDGLQQLFFQDFPWWTTRLSQFDSINIPWVAELPPEASAERELLQAQGIQSLLAVSVLHRESLLGLLGIHSAQQARIQSGETVELLRMVANLIADALEHRLSAESLRESEERYRCLSNASLEGIVIHDGDRVLDVNSTCVAMYGFTRSEFIGKGGLDFIAPESRQLVAEKIRAECEEPYEAMGLRKDGSTFPIEICARRIPYKGKIVRVVAFRDITEHKQDEEKLRKSEARFRELANLLPQSVFEIDLKGNFKFVNRHALESNGYSQEDFDKVLKPDQLLIPEDRNRVRENIARILDGEALGGIEYKAQRKDGSTFPVLVYSTPIIAEGKPVGLRGIVVDISERKRIEEAFQREKEFTESLIQTAQAIVLLLDTEGRIIHFNPYMEEVSGYRLDEVRGRDWFTIFLPKGDQERIRNLFLKAVNDIQTRGNINPIIRKDGGEREIEWYDKTLKDTDGNVVGLLVIGQDITERKRAEKALQESEARFQDIALSTSDWIWEVDAKGIYTFCSEKVEKVLGYTPQEIIGKTPFDLMPPEGAKRIGHWFREIAAARAPIIDLENWNLHKDGHLVCLLTNGIPVLDVQGNLVGYRGADKDITERKRAEEALRESEKKYRQLLETLREGIWAIDASAHTTFVNPQMAEMLGYTADEMLGRHLFTFMDEQGVEIAKQLLERRKAGIPEQHDFEFLRKDGTRIYTRLDTSSLIDEEGKYAGALASVMDMTEQRQLEAALREDEERLRVLFDNLTIGVYRTTPEGKILTTNPALVKMLGYASLKELESRNLEEEGFHPTYPRSQFKELMEQKGEVRGFESAWHTQDGSVIYVRENARAIRGKDGNILYYEGTAEDITERKKGEESLEFERKQLLSIFEGMDESVHVIDPATYEILYANPSLEKTFGRKLVGQICYKVFRNLDTPCENCVYRNVFENGGKPYKWEFHNPVVARTLAMSSQIIRWPDGRDVLLELATDITDQKRAELALRENEEKYRDLVENISEVVYAVDTHGVITYLSPVIETLTEHEPSEAIGRRFADFIHPEDRQYMIERLQQVLRGEPRQSSEFRIMTKSGAVRWVQTSSRPIVHNGQVLGVQGVLIDITERKRVEEALRESEERLRILFDNLTIGVYRTTPEGRILTANPAFVKMLGYSAFDELAARNLDDEAVYLAYPRDQFKALMERDGEIRGLEAVWKRRDGSFTSVRENARAVQGEDGEILYYEGTAEDITERKQAEEALRLTQFSIESIVDAALWMGPDAHFVYANDAACRMLGYSRQELLSMTAHDINPQHPPEVWPDHWRELKERRSFTFEACMRKKDGQGLSVEITPNYLEFEGKEYNCAFVRDITERKQIEQALRRSEEKFRTLIEQQGEGVVIADPNERFMFCNPAAEEIFGVPRGTLLGRNFEEFIDLETLEFIRRQTEKRREGEKNAYEIEIIRPSGEKRHIVILATPWLDENGQFAGAWGIFRDETERKRAERELRFRVELENLISTISTDFINLNSTEIDLGINRALQKIGEFTGADRSYVFLLSEDGTRADNTHEWCAEGIEAQIDNMKRMSADAFSWWAEKMLAFEDIYIPRVADLPEEATSEKAMLEAQDIKSLIVIPMAYRESLIGFVGFDFVREEKAWTQDVEASLRILRMAGEAIANALEHKETENALRESEAQYRSLIQNSNDAIYLLVEGKFEIINRRFAEMFGVTPEEVREPSFNFLQMVASRSHPLLEDRMRMAQRGEVPPPRYEFTALTKDGKEIEVETSVSRVPCRGGTATQGILRDVTERKKLEAQLRQAQKMQAIGTLAGGIAHDFNNILMAMLGYAEMAKIDLPEGTVARGDLEEVLKAGGRARDLVRQILAFSRQIDQERQPIQLHPVIKEALKLLRASLPATIEIRQNISTDCGAVMADPTQVHQVLMNLCSNAHHAMREKGGILEVELKSVDVDADFAVLVPNLREGPYVRLTLSDTGHGMDRPTMERIFEPFFTTKAVGVGTGMGLATVHGIVTSHNGAITVYSEPGKGTTFHVYLPRLESKAPDAPLQVESIPTGKERILFVDDEASLARLGKQMLERLGYDVTARTSSVEALEAFRAKSDKFDLVITDQTMPNITGMELAEEMMRIRPDIPIILATGFSETISPERAKQLGIREYIMKPVAARELAQVTRQVLDEMEKVK
jgi:PAS domain S-box-containing protein